MKLGFTSIYPFRPHVEHVYYLAKLMEGAGHDVCYLTCDAELASCYGRELKGFQSCGNAPNACLAALDHLRRREYHRCVCRVRRSCLHRTRHCCTRIPPPVR